MADPGSKIKPALSQLLKLADKLLLSGLGAVPKPIFDEFGRANLRRTGLVSLLAIPVHIIVILLFLSMNPTSANEMTWRQLIMISHAISLAVMLAFTLVVSRLPDEKSRLAQHVSYYFMLSFIMIAGLVFVSIDQMVGSSVIAFSLVCLLTGAIFLSRPLFALLYFFLGYVAFFIIYGAVQDNLNLLMSGRVNALVSAAAGFAISVVMWRYNVINARQNQQISEQQEILRFRNLELEKMAFFDPLTALPNRRFFDELVKKEIAQVRRGTRCSSLIMLDIDSFKVVNDTYGHSAGDEVLRQIGVLLQSTLRESDLISRRGGEEFIVLLPETPLDSAMTVAEKLRALVESHHFLIDGRKIRLTASFGVSQLRLPQGSQSNYYSDCDKALHKAKQKGRNRVESAIPA